MEYKKQYILSASVFIFTMVFVMLLLVPGTVLSPVADPSKEIIIDKGSHTITLRHGSFVKSFPVTTGGEESPTSTGEFEVLNKLEGVESYHGYTFPLWLGVYKVGEYENGIHSVLDNIRCNPWVGCIGNENCTPGSIILKQKDMEYVYDWAEEGVKVTIIN